MRKIIVLLLWLFLSGAIATDKVSSDIPQDDICPPHCSSIRVYTIYFPVIRYDGPPATNIQR